MGVAMYTGNGGNLPTRPQATVVKVMRGTDLVALDHLVATGIPHTLIDYGDGSE
ncbi:hypothetical protein [Saccharomonospora viridis]|uniref:hypothetical protein n=1 Tax=Saccharomonospora viridis TaxID=1852 RepID=UPI00145EE23D|nr:hypothetical protein [Saccharomonospora viridis]